MPNFRDGRICTRYLHNFNLTFNFFSFFFSQFMDIRKVNVDVNNPRQPGCFSSAFKIISFPWRPGRVVTPTSLPSWNLKCFSLFSASAVDGGYSDWSKFSECNASCGRGVKIRKRSCNSPEPTNGRKDCSDLGPAMESEACNSFPCRMLDFFFLSSFRDDLSHYRFFYLCIILFIFMQVVYCRLLDFSLKFSL